jgi:hypothetical protein
MSKKITYLSTLSVFLLALLAVGIQVPGSIQAQESEIESVDSTGSVNATGSGNATDTTETTSEPIAEPKVLSLSAGDSFAQQGTVTSTQDPLPGHEAHQLSLILPPRSDNSVYDGILTYTASKPVEVVVLQNFGNSTNIDSYYGGVATAPLGEGLVAISLMTPQYSGPINAASLPFAGNALALHTIDGEPFAATYTVTGDVRGVETFDNIVPAPIVEAAESQQDDTQTDEDGDEKDGDKKDKKSKGDKGDKKDKDNKDNDDEA